MGPSCRRRPISYWRHVELIDVRAAAGDLIAATRLAEDRLGSWQTEPVTRIQRALAAIAEVADDFDPRADTSRPPGGSNTYRRWTPLPAGASARDRVYDLYDACSDFLGVFYEREDARWAVVRRWSAAGQELRRVLILDPLSR